jgi:hypothetical protein
MQEARAFHEEELSMPELGRGKASSPLWTQHRVGQGKMGRKKRQPKAKAKAKTKPCGGLNASLGDEEAFDGLCPLYMGSVPGHVDDSP